VTWQEFSRRREGLEHALDGGLWLHRFTLGERPMAHLVSSDRARLVEWGRAVGLDERWLQYKPLRDPRTGVRVSAWHWDLWGDLLPPRPPAVRGPGTPA
jgi:hypothetical protein